MLPTGTVTFMFTDIEGSTRLLAELGPERYGEALAEHRKRLRDAFAAHGGVEVDTQGDAFFVAFADADAAVGSAEAAQQSLSDGPVRVRMGLHTGTPHLTAEGYVGHDVHLGARIAAAGHGGQVLMSAATREALAGDADITDLGEHRLKDFPTPVWIYQLGAERFPPLKTISNTNLPRPTSSFVGRERELSDVTSLVRQRARLVTLTGPGGTGKTRLMLEAAAELVPEFRSGVFWVGLAELRDPALVLDAIGRTLGAREGVAEHIGEREMLLVLDNLEQVLEAAPQLANLVEACRNLHLLVTSRERLRVRGEVEYAVPPLTEDEAVDLFAQRAGLVADATVAELCRRLDNLPLAVELAAARTSVLSPAQILERLAQRLDLLKGGRDAEARQQTLRATIEWSYELLTADEKQLFARLSIFSGGSTLEAAEELAGAELDVLQSLVDKSLVRHSGERFWMLETIRDFAAERLDASGQAEVLRRRHAVYYLALAEAAGVSVEGVKPSGQWERLDLVIAEQANLRAVLDAAVDAHPELGLRLAAALEQFWVTQAPSEGVRRLEALLERAEEASPDLRARALRCLGGALQNTGQHERAQDAYKKSREIYRAARDEAGVATMDFRLGTSYLNLSQPRRARPLLETSLAMFRRLGRPVGECEAFGKLASLELEYGDPKRGHEMLEQNLEMARDVGFTWWEQWKLWELAAYALKTGALLEAGLRARDALRLSRRLNDRVGKVYGLANLAWHAAEHSAAFRAGTLWGAIEAEELRGRIGPWEGERESYAAHVLAVRGPEFERGRAQAGRMSLDDAVEYALSDA
jgi:predicted ATPase